MDTTAYVVVDIWQVKPGKEEEIRGVLGEAARLFRARPGILSVDFSALGGDASRYLVVFRYENQDARMAFQQTPDLAATMQRLSLLWDLESPVWQGHQSGL